MPIHRRLITSCCCCWPTVVVIVLAVCGMATGANNNGSGISKHEAASGMHHLHLYLHESSIGPNPSVVLIINGTGAPTSPSGERFGNTRVMDDVLTDGPSLSSSRAVGRAQGMYVMASLQPGQPALMLTVNLVLTAYDGYAAGSTLTVVGRNNVTAPVRELAVVGGTGRFRMATGYVLWKTFSDKGDTAVLELDIFVRTADDA